MSADTTDAAERLMAKIRAFVQDSLDDDERVLFAQLLAPGILEAHARAVTADADVDADADADADVSGFGMGVAEPDLDDPDWRPAPLPARLVRAVQRANMRIVID